MLALGLQTLLLMSAAYLLGAALACLLRRSFFAATARAPRSVVKHVDPLPDVDPDLVGARRFGRAGAGPDVTPIAQPTPAAAPRRTATANDAAPQDLKLVNGIDATTEAALNRLGIHRYDVIAGWVRGDLDRVAQGLGIRRQRMNRENWIEQAQMLAAGVETHYARRRARGETASAVPSPHQGERRRLVAQPQPSPSGGPVPAATPSRRTASMPPAASAAGRPGSAPDRPPSAGRAAVSAPPRVSERAAFARGPSALAPSEAVTSPIVALPARPGTASRPAPLAAPAVAAMPASAPLSPIEPARPLRPPPASRVDNLQRIRGIDGPMAQRLAAAGVSRYAQIAAWSATEVARFDRDLAGNGRIARENWIEQAQILTRGGATTFSRAFDAGSTGGAATLPPPLAPKPGETVAAETSKVASAPVPKAGLLGTLRSVRSQAYHNPEPGPEAAHRVGSHNRVVRSSPPQDLKRIRGIGVLIERRLNAMQIATYEQIANWTAEDIERVSRTLDFKGRIERENWVEQARILASGGATEFSRRVDRGDVETGRYRP
jgi:predicted flap endonuclease-1-like 5' DNA nuclease